MKYTVCWCLVCFFTSLFASVVYCYMLTYYLLIPCVFMYTLGVELFLYCYKNSLTYLSKAKQWLLFCTTSLVGVGIPCLVCSMPTPSALKYALFLNALVVIHALFTYIKQCKRRRDVL